MTEEALAHWGLLRQKQTNKSLRVILTQVANLDFTDLEKNGTVKQTKSL